MKLILCLSEDNHGKKWKHGLEHLLQVKAEGAELVHPGEDRRDLDQCIQNIPQILLKSSNLQR